MKRLRISALEICSKLAASDHPGDDADAPRYLLINYRLADLLLRVSSKDRKGTLQKAREAYERYLSLLDQYEILTGVEKKLYSAYTEYPSTFSTINNTDPNARRGAKIANFKLEKELKQKLEVIPTYRMTEAKIMLTPPSSQPKVQPTSRMTTTPSASLN